RAAVARTRFALDNGFGRLGVDLAQVGANASRVLSEIAFPQARFGAHVDAAASPRGRNADDDVVLEAEPPRRVGRFDSAFRRHARVDLPTHVARNIECTSIRLLGGTP